MRSIREPTTFVEVGGEEAGISRVGFSTRGQDCCTDHQLEALKEKKETPRQAVPASSWLWNGMWHSPGGNGPASGLSPRQGVHHFCPWGIYSNNQHKSLGSTSDISVTLPRRGVRFLRTRFLLVLSPAQYSQSTEE
jgi:hypothetical protein